VDDEDVEAGGAVVVVGHGGGGAVVVVVVVVPLVVVVPGLQGMVVDVVVLDVVGVVVVVVDCGVVVVVVGGRVVVVVLPGLAGCVVGVAVGGGDVGLVVVGGVVGRDVVGSPPLLGATVPLAAVRPESARSAETCGPDDDPPAPAPRMLAQATRCEVTERSQFTSRESSPPLNHLRARTKSPQRSVSSRTLGRNPTAMLTAAMSNRSAA
jgi:hypothetical protein